METVPVKKSRKKSQQRWEKILSVSTELFVDRGFFAASMQDISDRVGIKKASLYYYVESKEEILFEILRGLHSGGEIIIDSINYSSKDLLAELRSLLIHMTIYAAKHARRMEIFARDFDYLNPDQQREIISERRIYSNAVQKLVTMAIERGEVSDTVDPLIATRTMLSAVTSVSEWFRADKKPQSEKIAVQTANLLVAGIANYPQ